MGAAPPARYRGIDMATARRARLSTDARREQLVALGVEMFSERPFDEVSIDDIAASAGISKGLLYHYFPSKRDFYVAVVRHSADEMQAVTETDPDLAPLDAPVDRPGSLPGVRRHPRPRLLDRAARRHRLRPRGRGHRRGRPLRDGDRILDDLPGGEPVARRAHRGPRLDRLRRGSEPRVARAPRAQSREELRDLLIQALTGAIGATASHYAVRLSVVRRRLRRGAALTASPRRSSVAPARPPCRARASSC